MFIHSKFSWISLVKIILFIFIINAGFARILLFPNIIKGIFSFNFPYYFSDWKVVYSISQFYFRRTQFTQSIVISFFFFYHIFIFWKVRHTMKITSTIKQKNINLISNNSVWTFLTYNLKNVKNRILFHLQLKWLNYNATISEVILTELLYLIVYSLSFMCSVPLKIIGFFMYS